MIVLSQKTIRFGALSVLVAILLRLVFSPGGVQASVSVFHPEVCLGGWHNSEQAAGKPDFESPLPENYTTQNSAQLAANSSGELFCGNFFGEQPEQGLPRGVTVRLNWWFQYGDSTRELELDLFEQNEPIVIELGSDQGPDDFVAAEQGGLVTASSTDEEVGDSGAAEALTAPLDSLDEVLPAGDGTSEEDNLVVEVIATDDAPAVEGAPTLPEATIAESEPVITEDKAATPDAQPSEAQPAEEDVSLWQQIRQFLAPSAMAQEEESTSESESAASSTTILVVPESEPLPSTEDESDTVEESSIVEEVETILTEELEVDKALDTEIEPEIASTTAPAADESADLGAVTGDSESAEEYLSESAETETTHAEEVLGGVLVPGGDDRFIEIVYSLGEEEGVLGYASLDDVAGAVFALPDELVTDWGQLAALQIGIKTLPVLSNTPEILLESMTLEVAYQDFEAVDLPERPLIGSVDDVIDIEGSRFIIQDRSTFGGDEHPAFEINLDEFSTSAEEARAQTEAEREVERGLRQEERRQQVENALDVLNQASWGGIVPTPQVEPTETASTTPTTASEAVSSSTEAVQPAEAEQSGAIGPDSEARVDETAGTPEGEQVSWWRDFLAFLQVNTAQAQAAARVYSVKVYDPEGQETSIRPVVEQAGNSLRVVLPRQPDNFKPGKYDVELILEQDSVYYRTHVDFVWGVLALNSDQDVYRPGEVAYLQAAVLTDTGETVCNADIRIAITLPAGEVRTFSTLDGGVINSENCNGNNVTDVADYQAWFRETSMVGVYQMAVTNLENDYTVSSSFRVQESPTMIVERVGATRINPIAAYVMRTEVVLQESFSGRIVEQIPGVFTIESHTADQIVRRDGRQYLVKEVQHAMRGDRVVFEYQYRAPLVSPYFYELGPAALYAGRILRNAAATEQRSWQIASDAVGDGDIAIYTDTNNTHNINNTAWTGVPFNNQARQDSTFAQNANDIDVDLGATGGHFLFGYNVSVYDSGYNNRVNFLGRATLNGTPLPWGYSQGYQRNTSNDTYTMTGAGIIEAAANDDLRIEIQRAGSNNSGTQTVDFANFWVMKLKSDWGYLRISYNDTGTGFSIPSSTWLTLAPDSIDEIDSGYSYNPASVGSQIYGVASMQIMNGVDGAWPVFLGNDTLQSGTFDLVVDEDTYGDAERSHTTETLGHMSFGATTTEGIITDSGGSTIGAFGKITSVGTTATSETFAVSLTNPVVFTTYTLDSNANEPAVVRVENISSTGFDAYIQDATPSGSPTADAVYWIAVEAGVHTLAGGVDLQVGTTTVSGLNSTSDWSNTPMVQITPDASLAEPVTVLSQIQTTNDAGWQAAWVSGGTNSTEASISSGIYVGRHNGADGSARSAETVGYVIAELGNDTMSTGVDYNIGESGSVTGVEDDNPVTVTPALSGNQGNGINIAPGKYLATYNVGADENLVRVIINTRLTLNGAPIPQSYAYSYIRAVNSTDEGIASAMVIFEAPGSSTSTLALQARSGDDSTTLPVINYDQTALSLVRLPDTADYLRVHEGELGGGQVIGAGGSSIITHDTEAEEDATSFSHDTSTGRVTINQDGDYLFTFGSMSTRASGGTRNTVEYSWYKNAVQEAIGRHNMYIRGDQGDQDTYEGGGSTFALFDSLVATDIIDIREGDTGDNGNSDALMADRHGITAVRINDLFAVVGTASTTQTHVRWRNDDGSESLATWQAAEDTAITDVVPLETQRLRLQVSNEGTADATGVQFRLEVSDPNPASCAVASYTRVDTSPDWNMASSAEFTDGAATTDVAGGLTNENTTFVAGEIKDTNDTAGAITLTSTEFTEIEYALAATASATQGATYCFRVSNAGTPLTTYTTYASLIVGARDLTQTRFRWLYNNEDETNADAVGAENFTIVNVPKNDIQRLRFAVSNEGTAGSAGEAYRLEVSEANPGTCATGTYERLSTDADWSMADTKEFTDGTASTDVAGRLTNDNTTFVAGELKDTTDETGSITLSTTEFTELEFAIKPNNAATDGATYCFRLTNAGTALDTYTTYAEATVASTAIEIFRSVGNTTSSLESAQATIEISGNTLTYSTDPTNGAGNHGVGDLVVYSDGGTTYGAFITARASATSYTVANYTGGRPRKVSAGQALDGIYRGFTGLRDWDFQLITNVNSSIPDTDNIDDEVLYNFTGDTDLVAQNIVANVALYADAEDAPTGALQISGWTTDAESNIKIYTPQDSTEVGISQRHSGIANTGYVYKPSSSSIGVYRLIWVQDAYVTIEGIELSGENITNKDVLYGVLYQPDEDGMLTLTHSIIRDITNSTAEDVDNSFTHAVQLDGTGAPAQIDAQISNNLIYNIQNVSTFATSNVIAIDGLGSNTDQVWAYNNTIFGIHDSGSSSGGAYGIKQGDITALIAKNNYVGKIITDSGVVAEAYSGTFNASSDKNVSSDATAVGASSAQDMNNYGAYFVGTSDGQIDLRLRDDSSVLWGITGEDLNPTDPDGGAGISDDIEGDARDTATPDIGADEWDGVIVSRTIYRSIGGTATNLNTATATMSISGSTATFSVDPTGLNDNMGVGDAIIYSTDGTTQLAFIAGRISDTEWTVQDYAGGIPAGTGITTPVLYRTHQTLDDWQDQVEADVNDNIDNDVSNLVLLQSSDLSADNYQLSLALYKDAVDTGDVFSLAGWTTDASHYVRVYTPTDPSQVITGQRHDGVAGSGYVFAPAVDLGGGFDNLVRLNGSYDRLEGIEISAVNITNGENLRGILIGAGSSHARIEGVIVHSIANSTFDDTDGSTVRGIDIQTSTGPSYISNTLVYDIEGVSENGSSDAYGIALTNNNTTVYIYNNTVFGIRQTAVGGRNAYGIHNGSGGTLIVKNNYVGDVESANGFALGFNNNFASGSTNNVSFDGSADDDVDMVNAVVNQASYASYFANAFGGSKDFHLTNDSNVLWGSYGADLDTDASLPITDDIDGDARDAAQPDIGADEFSGTPAVADLTQTHYRWRNDDEGELLATWAAAEDVPYTTFAAGMIKRLRFQVSNEGAAGSGGEIYRLEVSDADPGSCSAASYARVDASSTWGMIASAYVSDGAATQDVSGGLTNENTTFVAGSSQSTDDESGSISLSTTEFTELEYVIQPLVAAAGSSFCFRLTDSGSVLNTYSVYGEATVLEQSLSFSVSDSTIGFGDILPAASRFATGDAAGSPTEVVAHTLSASTNAPSGYSISASGPTLTAGGFTINTIGATPTAPSAGTEQFGLRLSASGGSGVVSSPYNTSNYAYDAVSSDIIATLPNGDGIQTIYSAYYLASIAALTEPGNYSTVIQYTITANF